MDRKERKDQKVLKALAESSLDQINFAKLFNKSPLFKGDCLSCAQQLSAFLDLSTEFLLSADASGHIIYVNETFSRQLQYLRDACIGSELISYFKPNDQHRLVNAWLLLEENDCREIRGIDFEKANGGCITVDLKIHRFQADQPVYICAWPSHRSNFSDRMLKTVMELEDVGTWQLDLRSKVCDWTETTRSIHDITAPLSIDLELLLNYYEPSDQRLLMDAMAACIELRQSFDLELKLQSQAGEHRWVRWIGSASFDDQDQTPLFIEGIALDISKTKHLNAQLQQRNAELTLLKERFQLALRGSCIGIWDWRHGEDEIIWDNGMSAIYGLQTPLPRVSFRAWKRMIHPDDVKGLESDLKEAIATKGQINRIFRIRTHTLGLRYIKCLAYVLGDQPGNCRILGVNFDVTKDKLRELELEKARKVAEEALSYKERFFANMSHEIRTPLNGIMGVTKLLTEHLSYDEEAQNMLGIITNSSQTLMTVINDILDYSKLEAGKIRLENQGFDLSKLLVDSLRLFQPNAMNKQLQLKFTTNIEGGFFVHSDQVRIQQIIGNLLSNAIKFTECGFVEVRLHILSEDANYVVVEIDVIDSGIGMSEDQLNHIFSPFFQVEQSPSRRFGGTGLGLSISHSLSSLLGGKLSCTSEPGKGSHFRLEISLEKISDHPTKLKESEVKQEKTATCNQDLHILVAEDNDINRFVVRGYLRLLGYQADYANNGFEAIEKSQASDYDLILMDCFMPELDGFDAARRILDLHSEAAKSKPYIAALTASVMKEDRDRCLQAGMLEILAKPLNERELQKTLERAKEFKQGRLNSENGGPNTGSKKAPH